jgi:hypothetical protein
MLYLPGEDDFASVVFLSIIGEIGVELSLGREPKTRTTRVLVVPKDTNNILGNDLYQIKVITSIYVQLHLHK